MNQGDTGEASLPVYRVLRLTAYRRKQKRFALKRAMRGASLFFRPVHREDASMTTLHESEQHRAKRTIEAT